MDKPEALAERVRHLEMEFRKFSNPANLYKRSMFDRGGLRIDQVTKKYVDDRVVFLTTPLTSTDFDGDSFSTTAKTKIDLSDKFGVPAGVKAVLALITARDSGSSAISSWIGIAPNDTAGQMSIINTLTGMANDVAQSVNGVCPCNVDGDIYYQIAASDVSTLDLWIYIWGYFL